MVKKNPSWHKGDEVWRERERERERTEEKEREGERLKMVAS